MILAKNILVLRASSSVEKLSGDSDLSVQADILEDIPRPVPMHTLRARVKQLQRCVINTNSHGLYVMDARPLGRK
jgi:hypothetical protein